MMAGIFSLGTGMLWAIVRRVWPYRLPQVINLSKTQMGIVACALYLLLVFDILFIATPLFVELQLNTSFEQRLTVLAPHLPDQQMKEIRASWATMKTRHDYESINEGLEQLADENGVELPRLLLP